MSSISYPSLNFMVYFDRLEDPRDAGSITYPLSEILFLVLSALISDCEGWEEIEDFGVDQLDWLRQYYPYADEIPRHGTLNRVFSLLDSSQFEQCFAHWVASLGSLPLGSLINIDGKALRGSGSSSSQAIHIVSAWCSQAQLTLGQVKTAEKSNEITAIPQLLDLLVIETHLVSIDAMGCQRKIADKIRDKKGHYLLAVKENQPTLLAEIEHSFRTLDPWSEDHKAEKNRSRNEERTCQVIDDLSLIHSASRWKDLRQVIRLQSQRESLITGKKESFTRYYMTSAQGNAQAFNRDIRGHWGIENKLHWTLDVIFREDHCQKSQGHAPANMAIVRKVALNVLKKDQKQETQKRKTSLNRKRKKAARDLKFRDRIIQLM